MSRKPHVQETFERLEKIWTSTKCMKNKITIPITERKIKKVTVLYLVRHGQTDWNKENRCQGRIDTELNSEGIFRLKP